jgi:hypothetical protein
MSRLTGRDPNRRGQGGSVIGIRIYWDKDILGPENKENVRVEEAVDAVSPKAAIEEIATLLGKHGE